MITISRRILFSLLGLTGLGIIANRWFSNTSKGVDMIKKNFALDFQWQTQEPFLFCVHHYDYYPKGTAAYGPDPSLLSGRNMGSDFEAKDGFRMYHGDVVPGFPVHPHRGFETITIVRKGYIDHADSLGAAGRYGQGDVQWMTAGKGVQHSEMFPLLRQDQDNTVELFQIWLNLPKKSKMSEPHFTMFWSEKIPTREFDNNKVKLTIVAGQYDGTKALTPPPDSWASQEESDTAIWLLKIEPGGQFEIPASVSTTARSLYFFNGDGAKINDQLVAEKSGLFMAADTALKVTAGAKAIEFLMLQSKPIGEPVVQYGPFVMNSQAEITQTISDYQRTHFGGWPWDRDDMVHGSEIKRFARYPAGQEEKP